ncbi:MAG: D-tyrosyl-tRNA(Tyr) deacylase [Acidobacteria bacterium]|nr:D-tyrosyl-tRNA(Tyr) deacylase [Acidobacteriota bacterium]
MRAIIQRVSSASVTVDGDATGAIGPGLLILLGVRREDTRDDALYLLDRILGLRIFADQNGKMNLSLLDTGGSLLVVSQFTLYADTRSGRRPSFDSAAPAEQARRLYEDFVAAACARGVNTQTGVFQAMMTVALTNEGPVTFIVESKNG